ncbi:hypothetical protein HY251_03735 [bacterium]|nr:hypothetical protein [bacterium]
MLVLVPVAIALAATAGVRARAWAPLVKLTAGSGPDAPLYGLTADEPTRAFFLSVLEKLEAFDLQALYETLPEEEDGGWRRVRFTGRSESGKYEVRKAAPKDACACDPDGSLGSRFGDLAVAFRSRRAKEDGDNFLASIRAGIGTGSVSWPRLLAAIAETIRLVESTAPLAPKLDAALRPAPASLDEVKKDNPRLGAEDLEALALFREAYPRFYDHLRELYQVDDILVYDPDEEPYKQIHLVISVRREAAKEKHPAIVEWLTGMGPLITGRVDFTDEKGRTCATIRFSTKDLALTIDAFVAGGKLLPVESGHVLANEGVDFEETLSAKRRDRWTLDFDVNGIVTEVHDLVFKVDYERTQDSMTAKIVLDEEPKVRVHGSAYGVIPTWAIDVFIPGNMEEITRSFFRVLAKGNDGKGLVLEVAERGGKNGSNVLEVSGQHESLNNFLVRLGFKISRRKLIPPEDAVNDIADYLRKGHEAFAKDLADFSADSK